MQSAVLITESSKDYELLDSGAGEKLERFGQFVLARPDPQALWSKRLPESKWNEADGVFTRDEKRGEWKLKSGIPEKWRINIGGLNLYVKPTAFKHTGVFPEQTNNWDWLREQLKEEVTTSISGEPSHFVLNLFGYTGAATLACAQAGAGVAHIDGSKSAIGWARENAELSGLEKKPVRWILEDARAFVKRELKRGRKYHGIIMDPPAFGHGPEGELWKIEEDFLPLVQSCFDILSEKPSFFIINGYSAGYSSLAYENILSQLVSKFGGTLETGELVIRESQMSGIPSRVLPCGIFARWSSR